VAARPIYLGLHRLERQRLLTSEWRRVPGRSLTAKYYRVTSAGLGRLGNDAAEARPALHPLSVVVVIAVVGQSLAVASQRASRPPRLTILMDSDVPTPADEWRRAAIEVTRILGAIGVRSDFPGRAAPAGFVVHVVIAAPRAARPRSGEVPLGETPPVGQQQRAEIVLFHDSIQAFAQIHRRPVWSVLALVVVHETGHVLLPSPAHSSAGIMQTPWDRHTMEEADDARLGFTPQQGAQIRQRLDRCCALTAAR